MKFRISGILKPLRSAIILLIAFSVGAGLVWIGKDNKSPPDSTSVPFESTPLSANFDTYVSKNTLIYLKTPCNSETIQPKFFLHIVPIDTKDLPAHRNQWAFDNLDFDFAQHGTMVDGECVATVPLPQYRISSIRTGQYIKDGNDFLHVWEDEFSPTVGVEERPRPTVSENRIFKNNHPLTINSFLYALQFYPIELESFFAWGGGDRSNWRRLAGCHDTRETRFGFFRWLRELS